MDFNLNEYHRNISDELLLEDVKDISKKIGRNILTQNEYKKAGGKFGKNTFLRRFGSWNNVLVLCELKVNQRQLDAAKGSHMHQHIETEELLMDLKSVAIYLNKDSLSSKEYGKNGKYSVATYFKRFGTWNKALCDAGLKSFSRVSSQRLNDEELLKEIECVWIKLGRQPTSTDIKNGISKYSLHAYAEHFGGWRGALDAFIKFVNESSDCVIKKEKAPEKEVQYMDDVVSNSGYKHKTPRDVNLRLRFKIMQRDNFKCCVCGASPATNPSVELHIDHIVPWSKGGETIPENLQTLCSKCNLGKSNLI